MPRIQLVLYRRRRAGRDLIGRIGSQDDEVHFIDCHTSPVERGAGGVHGQVGRHLILCHDVALTDADVFHQPLIDRFTEHLFHLLVRNDSARHIGPGADDLCVAHR